MRVSLRSFESPGGRVYLLYLYKRSFEGLIVYSGTGTISDTMEVDCALVIVANTTLMDDHQSAFAAEMASEYPTIVQAHLG